MEAEGSRGRVDVGGNIVEADLSFVAGVKVGEWVLVHAGFAIQRYDEAEAQETLRLLREVYEKAHG